MQKDEIKEILEFDFQSQGERIEINEYERNILKDYITNLQEENERLKEQNKMSDEQIEKTFEVVSEHIYKSRCEKAIEWIRWVQSGNSTKYLEPIINTDELDDLLNILQGVDKE